MPIQAMRRYSEILKVMPRQDSKGQPREEEPVVETTIDKAFPWLFLGKGGK
ncbi:hypothetical protein FD09_GL002607 [Schleiferilactobacillus perolens DSM 12744]|uniref:Uncharacterized protein n=1 Tax=Schleiferilactobacillus perolens DSM 12744 TaxID=1423792 RepID=A0A0R1N6H1_9LACO|nr:hypothetical protein FD09_GL002607 [Schleiferilactobacillus perolens DSM 12744]